MTDLTSDDVFPDDSSSYAVNLCEELHDARLAENQVCDASKFTEYYLQTRSSLRAFLISLIFSQEAVEDCLQETCIVLWNKKEDHWELEDFRKVAFTTARFKALSWLKKNKPAKHLTLSPEIAEKLAMRAAEEADKVDRSYTIDRLDALKQCMATLSDDQQALILARYEDSNTEALTKLATKKNLSLAAIYKQLQRIRTSLRKCIHYRITRNNP